MYKKGVSFGWIGIIAILVSFFAIATVLYLSFGRGEVKQLGESTACKVSIIQSKSFLGRLQMEDWPNLKGCPVDSVEIKGENENEIIKELSEYMFKAAKEFGDGEYYSKKGGRYCSKRYYPVTFGKQDLKISKEKFYFYLDKNRPNKINFKILGYNHVLAIGYAEKVGDPFIDTNLIYNIVFFADFEISILRVVGEVLPSTLEKSIESKFTAIELIEDNELKKLQCSNPV